MLNALAFDIGARSATILADPANDPRQMYHSGLPIQQGWFPWTVQLLAVFALGYALSGRDRTKRWWLVWLPLIALIGVGTGLWSYWWVYYDQGAADDPLPGALWFWAGASAAAAAAFVLGWRRQWWGRRAVAALALPLCLLCVALVTNEGVGYYRTLEEAWADLDAGPLPNQVDYQDLAALEGTPQTVGRIVPVDIPNDVSGFSHRTEYVYLPPAWFATKQPPQLPVIMMIGGEFDTPSHWVRVGDAAKIADDFAAQHGGNAPVLVFVDSGGAFNNDTECVNGPRGNAADHLTKEVPPYLVSQFKTSADSANWGVVGFSAGGTCAVDLTVMHPELFSAFLDIAGDLYPDAGTKDQTIQRLFGGNLAAFNEFDPTQAMAKHGPYQHTAGWFQSSNSETKHAGGKGAQAAAQDTSSNGFGGHDAAGFESNQVHVAAAQQLCSEGKQVGIDCTVQIKPGGHTWQYASAAFKGALPWFAGYLAVPGALPVALPASS